MRAHFQKYKLVYLSLLFVSQLTYYFCLPKVLFDDPYSRVVYDKDGNLMGAKIAGDGQWRFSLIDSVPSKFEQCILAFEDQRFYYHPGFDPIGIFGALIQNIKARKVVRGGSTLTMQVMRLASKGNKRTFLNKIKETLKATRLELRDSKVDILKLYVSHAPFGGNVVGLEAASWRYYHKSPHLLSWAESAMLAVLPNAPSLIHPGKNRASLRNKRDRLLALLLQNRTIDAVTYRLALLEPIPDAPIPLPQLTPHLIHRSSMYGEEFELNTTIDQDIQRVTQEAVDFYHQQYEEQGINNMAALVLDTHSGEVLGYVGNANNTRHEQDVDMVQARRSTGSVLKPFLYAKAIDEGILTMKVLMDDIPIYINGFHPENYDRSYRGVVPADQALVQSLNVPFVLLLQEYGIEKFINTLKSHGLTTIDKGSDHYGLSLIIGGAEGSLWDLCGAYATYGRILMDYTKYQAKYIDYPMLSPRIESIDDKHRTLVDEPPLVSAGAIYHTFESLRGLKRPAEEGQWDQFSSSKKIAWKTGTSFGHKDAWAIGVSPKYTIGIWVGNADGEGVSGLIGVKKAAPVMFDIFNRLSDSEWFDTPYDDLESIAMCSVSGMLATRYCAKMDTIYLSTRGLRYKCTYHVPTYLNAEQTLSVNSSCYNVQDIVEKGWFSLPPAQGDYYKKMNPDYINIPPLDAKCKGESSRLLGIIYPPKNGEVIIPQNLNNELEKVILEAVHLTNGGAIYWYLDDEFLGVTTDFHTMSIAPQKGNHTLTIMDENGDRISRVFTVDINE